MTGRSILVALATVLLISPPVAHAGVTGPEIVRVRVGIAGHYKAGLWTPVEVVLRGGSEATQGQVILTVPDGDGVPTRIATPPDQPCRLEAGQEKAVLLYSRLGRVESSMTVEFRGGEGNLARRSFQAGEVDGQSQFPLAIGEKESLIVVIGRETQGIEDAARIVHPQSGDHAIVVRLDDFSQMPADWWGYEGIDLVFVSTTEPNRFAGLTADSPRIQAMQQWVRMGGRLLLSAGRNGASVLADKAPFNSLAPGKFQKVLARRQTTALETYCGSRIPIVRSSGPAVQVCQLSDVQGAVEVRDGNLPMIVRRTEGLGHITFLAFDLDEAPLRDWLDRPALVARLLDIAPTNQESLREGSAVIHHGYSDLAGQLRSALDQFPQVKIVPFWVVAAILVAYLLLIGPVDYFVVRKLFKRAVLTWVTFPIVVLGVCVAAYFAAHSLKGDRIRVNQVDLVDVDCFTGQVRGTAWANIFSPTVEQYDLSFAPQGVDGRAAQGRTVAAWMGLPGDGLGGMNPRTVTPATWRQPYEFAPSLDALAGVPIQVWSTKSLNARWLSQTAVRIDTQLVERDRVLEGSVSNNLDVPLKDCLLCYDRWVYNLGTLQPGQSIELGISVPRRDLTMFLTGQKLLGAEGREQNTPYDRSNTDPAYILRAMMFFKAAGGFQYTGLVNRYQSFVDLSDLIKSGHAILIASPSGSPGSARVGAQLLRDGKPLESPDDNHLTIYRFVLPVKKAEP